MNHLILKNDPRFSMTVDIVIPFYDVDSMGIVWHGNYFRYFEVVRETLLNKVGYGYREMHASGYSWPIIDARLKYIKSNTFGQTIQVSAQITECENRLRIDYQIFNIDTQTRTTVGHTIQVAVANDTGEMCFLSPNILWQRMGLCEDEN